MRRREFLRSSLTGAAVLVPGSGVLANWDWTTSITAVEPLMPINESFTNIFRAADNGVVQDVRYFIEQMGIDVNVKGMYGFSPLHWASGRCESLEIVQYLVSHGADVHVKDNVGDTPLVLAASYGSLEVVQYLVSQGADVNAKGRSETPINAAASHGNWDIVKYLVSQGADVKMNTGKTPLHTAIDADNLEMIQLNFCKT